MTPLKIIYESSRVVDLTTGVLLCCKKISITRKVEQIPKKDKAKASKEEGEEIGWYSCWISTQPKYYKYLVNIFTWAF